MAEDQGEKTEAPSARRRQEARDEGNVARSQDLVAAVLLLGVFLLLRSFGPAIMAAMKAAVHRTLSPDALADPSPDNAMAALLAVVVPIAQAAAPMFVGVMVLAVVSNLFQVGLILNVGRLAPKLENLNPLNNFAKMFQGPGLVAFGMNLLKLLLVGWVAWAAVTSRLGLLLSTQRLTFMQVFGVACTVVFAVAMRLGVLLLVLALIDYVYHRFHQERMLRMTKDEVKREMRQFDGDPKIKQRRRQIALQAASKKLSATVPTADVVVTNPTHFAIALKYDSAAMHAPRVIAKGQDLIAQRIRELAVENGIPIVERKPLARALYKMCQVGQEIPEQFFSAVAEVLAYVWELTGRSRQRAVGSGQ